LGSPPLWARHQLADDGYRLSQLRYDLSKLRANGLVHRFRIVPTLANRQPALAVYRRDSEAGGYRAWGIWVLTTDGDAIAEIAAFVDPTLLPRFGLPGHA